MPLRLRSLFRRRRSERELDEELRDHLHRRVEEGVARGLTREDARYAALRAMGGLEQRKEECRDARQVRPFDDLLRDLSYAARMLRRSPGFTAAAVLSLALGIGANTAIFTVIDALTLRTMAVREPQRLVMLRGEDHTRPHPFWYQFWQRDYERLRDRAQVFSETFAACLVDRTGVAAGGTMDPGPARVELATGNYFTGLGVNAAIGRTFTPADDRVPGGHPVAVISDAYWTQRFSRAPDVLSRTLSLNGVTYTIFGVTSPAFVGDWVGRPTDIWLPSTMHAQVLLEEPPTRLNCLRVFARLKPGVDIRQAEAAMQPILRQMQREGLATPQQPPIPEQLRLNLMPAANGYSPQRENLAESLGILTVVVGLVLLITCVNVANLLLARAAARRKEMALRLSLGASRGRVMRQMFTESVLLATLGGALGVLFSYWGTHAFSTLSLGAVQTDARVGSNWLSFDVHPDARVLMFTTALCLLTGILFGLAPAFRGSKISLAPALTQRGGPSNGSGLRFGLGKILVIVHVAVSLLLLAGAGLFVRTLRNLKTQDLGVDREHVLLVWTAPGQVGREGAALLDLWRTVRERISSLPGIRSAGLSNQGLLNGWDGGSPGGAMTIVGQPPKAAGLPGWVTFVSPGFFESAGTKLLAGRDFTERDVEKSPRVVIVNEGFARHYFGGQNPIGHHLLAANPNSPAEIVGVVKDAANGTPRARNLGLPYYPYRQFGRAIGRMCIAVRTVGDPTGMIGRVRQELRDIDPTLPVLKIDTVKEQLDDVTVEDRVMATLSSFFGALAVLLACLGLYGVMAYAVSRRTGEIGVRLALGASRGRVLGMVLKQTLLLVAAGVAIGVPATLAATRLIASRLYGVGASDPATIVLAVVLMIGVAALAGFLPARRASKVDPMVALRYE